MANQTQPRNDSQAAEAQLPPPIAQNDRELIGDSLKLSEANREGVDRFLYSSTGQQNSLLRDLMNISVPVLVGAITLLALPLEVNNNPIIKTRGLFVASLIIVVVDAILNLFTRLQILKQLQNVSFQVERYHIGLTVAAKNYMLTPTPDNAKAFIAAEKELPVLPEDKWLLMNGYKLVTGLLILGFLGLATSILFHITT